MRKTSLLRKTPLKSGKTSLKRTRLNKVGKSPLSKQKQKLWILCREIIRLKYGNTCYTCGKQGLEKGNWQTGHFITKSTCSAELAYSLENLRPQCYHCNINLSGNWVAFEKRLTAELGKNFVTNLKKRNEETKGRKYDIFWYGEKIKEYEEILLKLQNERR